MIDALGQLAWLQLWQLTALIALVGLVGRLIGRRAPAVMNCLWVVVFLKAVTPPLWSSPLGLFSWSQLPVVANESAGWFPRIASLDAPAADGWQAMGVGAAGWLFVVWLTGFVASVLVNVIRYSRLRRSLERYEVDASHPVHHLASGLAAELGFRNPPRLVVSPDGVGPAVCGLSRATVILPTALIDEFDAAVLRPVLMHELLHARRGDPLVAAIQSVAACVWWYHPLVWWAIREADVVTERCVDNRVVHSEGSGGYARALLRVIELRCSLQHPAGLAGLCAADLTADRLREVFAAGRSATKSGGRFRGVFFAAAVVGVAAVALPGQPLPLVLACSPPQDKCLQVIAAATGGETPMVDAAPGFAGGHRQ